MYCSKACEELARRLNNKSEFFGRKNCSVCSAVRPVQDEIYLNGQSHWLCSRPCRNAFCFVNKVKLIYRNLTIRPLFMFSCCLSSDYIVGLWCVWSVVWCQSHSAVRSKRLLEEYSDYCCNLVLFQRLFLDPLAQVAQDWVLRSLPS